MTQISQITTAVCTAFNVEKTALLSPRRNADLPLARFAAYKLARDMTNYSLPTIGRVYHRDHTTVMHGLKRANKMLAENAHFTTRYSKAKELVSAVPVERPSLPEDNARFMAAYEAFSKMAAIFGLEVILEKLESK